MTTQTQTKTDDSWFYEDGPIPGLNQPEEFQQPIAVRTAEPAASAGRSMYAELAALAAARVNRDPARLIAEAKRVGGLLGSRAYYDFPAGGGRVTGPSIDLMDALAIVWGGIVQRVRIESETPQRVHLTGVVVDLLTLASVERDYVSAIAPAPGKFASKPDQADRWRVMQVQSASSKAVRGALEHALPAWLVDAALDAARSAASKAATGGRPLPEARRMALDTLGRHGLTRAELEAHVGQPFDLWAVEELDVLRTLARELADGRVAVEQVRATLALQAATAKPAAPAGGDSRLASLGVQTLPAPSTVAASGGTTTASGAGQGPATEVKPEDPERRAALDKLTALRQVHGDIVARVARAHGLVAPGRSTTAKVLEVIADVERELAPAPTEETLTAIGEWSLALGERGAEASVTEAFRAVGVDPEEGPKTEAQAQALLAALKQVGG